MSRRKVLPPKNSYRTERPSKLDLATFDFLMGFPSPFDALPEAWDPEADDGDDADRPECPCAQCEV